MTGDSLGGSGADEDYATVAYDTSTGNQLWVKRYNDPGNKPDRALALGVSPSGTEVFVTGSSIGPDRSNDYVTLAYDATTGAKLWVKRYKSPVGRPADDSPRALGVSPDGSEVFVTGASLGPGDDYEYATVAYDATTGAQLWGARYHGIGRGAFAFALDASPDSSEVYVTGTSFGATTGEDYATVAYNATTGAKLWVEHYNGTGTGNDVAYDVAASLDGTEVFVTGSSIGLGKDREDYATLAYDATTGAQLWVERYRGQGKEDMAVALGVSSDGTRVFVTGTSEGVTTGNDYATVAYDATTGTELWVERYNGPSPGAEHDLSSALGVSPDGSVVLVTGTSIGIGTSYDYATVAYEATTGTELWVQRYNGPDFDVANALAVSPEGSEVFVTGGSIESGINYDYATVAYSSP